MTEVGWGDAVAIAGLIAGIAAGFAVWFNWRQLKMTDEQLAAEKDKVETLGKVVAALAGMVETQKQQLVALLTQNQIAGNALQVRQQELALQAARLEWEQMGPLAKAGTWFARWQDERRSRRKERGGWW